MWNTWELLFHSKCINDIDHKWHQPVDKKWDCAEQSYNEVD